MYQVQRASRSEFVPLRRLRYHVRLWGEPGDAPPLVLLHGWMDVGASYQFMVDAFSPAFAQRRLMIAPDWRGFGLTGLDTQATGTASPYPGQDNYWFADYLADLDFLLDHYAPGQPVDLLGHSMGGNVVMLYAGVRPERIRHLVNLEGFGMAATRPAQAPGRYAKWMDELKRLHRGELELQSYENLPGVARRLMKTNPRLGPDKALWLAGHWARPNAAGRWQILGDAAHKLVNAQLYRVDEVLETWRRITAPTLSVVASENQMDTWWQGNYTLSEYQQRLAVVPHLEQAVLQDAGHMLHHDQPQQLAALIEAFVETKIAG